MVRRIQHIGGHQSILTAKIGAAMGWEAWDVARSEYRPTSAVAEFQKVGGEWKVISDIFNSNPAPQAR